MLEKEGPGGIQFILTKKRLLPESIYRSIYYLVAMSVVFHQKAFRFETLQSIHYYFLKKT